jgi:hypothetical protein
MSMDGPFFHAWCDDAGRIDALIAALFHPNTWGIETISLEESVAKVRADFAAEKSILTGLTPILSSGRTVLFDIAACRDEEQWHFTRGPLYMAPDDRRDLLLFTKIKIAYAYGDFRPVEVEAAVPAIEIHKDIEEIMMRLCAPDASTRVTTGGCTWLSEWGPPIHGCATYNADARVARDLALTWVHLRDGDKMACAAGLSLDVLAARVKAAPRGSRVAVPGDLVFTRKREPSRWDPDQSFREWRGDGIAFPSTAELVREQVLAALSTPPSALLDALEASAVPDEEWRAVEPSALEAIEAAKQGMPTYEVTFQYRRYFQFIQRHAPYHVRRLPNGGVLLATHPYRTLWPLWEGALYLLGLM